MDHLSIVRSFPRPKIFGIKGKIYKAQQTMLDLVPVHTILNPEKGSEFNFPFFASEVPLASAIDSVAEFIPSAPH